MRMQTATIQGDLNWKTAIPSRAVPSQYYGPTTLRRTTWTQGSKWGLTLMKNLSERHSRSSCRCQANTHECTRLEWPWWKVSSEFGVHPDGSWVRDVKHSGAIQLNHSVCLKPPESMFIHWLSTTNKQARIQYLNFSLYMGCEIYRLPSGSRFESSGFSPSAPISNRVRIY